MSSTTMSHAPMRAAPALSAPAETRRDEPREVIETACRIRFAHLPDGELARLGDHRGDLGAADTDAQVRRISARIRLDAVAGWTRVRRVGGKPGKWSRCGAAFRWIYLPVALYRRLPADPGILPSHLWRTPSSALRLVDSRDTLGLHHFHADTPAVRARGRGDCGATARALPRLHHVFVACDERRAHALRDDLRRGDAGAGDVKLRDRIAELDANAGMADVRSLSRVLDDPPADERHHPCRSRVVRRDGTAGESKSREPAQSGYGNSSRFRDSGRVAVASERDQSRECVRERLCVVGARSLWRGRQDLQRRVPVRSHDAAKS